MKKAWELNEAEFDHYRFMVSVNPKVGVYTSINGVNVIELRSINKTPAGLTYNYTFYLNKNKTYGTINNIRKLLLELPNEYNDWITYELVKEYGKNQTI